MGTIDGLRRLLGVCGSLQLFFFLLDEGALIGLMTFVSAMNAAIGYFLFLAGVFPPAPIGVASVAPPSIVLRPGVAGFVTGDRVHSLRCFCLLGLMLVRSVAITPPVCIRFFDSPTLPFVRYTVLLHNFEELAQSLRPAAFEVLSAWPETQTGDCGIDDGIFVYIWSSCAKLDETVQIFLQRRASLL